MAAYLGYTADEDARRCFVAVQLWLRTRIREEEECAIKNCWADTLVYCREPNRKLTNKETDEDDKSSPDSIAMKQH